MIWLCGEHKIGVSAIVRTEAELKPGDLNVVTWNCRLLKDYLKKVFLIKVLRKLR